MIFSIFITSLYLLLIYRLFNGWESVPQFKFTGIQNIIKVSVIVPFRNEESNLPSLINALRGQSYPFSATEIIFSDDHSNDASIDIVTSFALAYDNVRIVRLSEHEEGKKKALANAALQAEGELLIFIDADCIPGYDWIKTIVSFYLDTHPVLIASPVIISSGESFFGRFQSLEFLSLIGSTAGSFGTGKPIMVNGANLAVTKDVYLESIDYMQNQTLSGDDIFLLLHLKKVYPGKLSFLKSNDAVVLTKPVTGLWAFLRQRMRWTSKARYYRDFHILYSAVIVLIINLWLLNCIVMAFFISDYFYFWFGIFSVKSLIDFLFIRRVLKFFNKEALMRIFVISQFLYFLYVSFAGIAGNFFQSGWKGRKVKTI